MHGGLALERINGVTSHAHSASAEYLAPHEAAGHSHHDQNTDDESRQCSCLGDCSAGRSPIGVAAAGVSLHIDATIETPSTDVDYTSPRLVAPHFLLPFSNGPPAGSSRA
jgi:hypothetical protein